MKWKFWEVELKEDGWGVILLMMAAIVILAPVMLMSELIEWIRGIRNDNTK